jgi:hemolysin activation/secretion protein
MKNCVKNLLLLFIASLLMLPIKIMAQSSNLVSSSSTLVIHYKDSSNKIEGLGIKNTFQDVLKMYDYVNTIPALLAEKGYPVASIDSSWLIGENLHINLYVGLKYSWIKLRTSAVEETVLFKSGYTDKDFFDKPLSLSKLEILKQKILNEYEENGYPFATVYLDSIQIQEDKIAAFLKVNKGTIYKIDSIKNWGKLKINPKFLQRYLNISNGSMYKKSVLNDVDRRMLELPYGQTLQNASLNMLGTGAILNLYVDNKKSSEASAIFGFLPSANAGKFQLTGDVNLDLKNVFGAGEGFLLKYQALQPKSPRFNVGFDKPYIFNSAFGAGFLFELFKKDSSFIQVNAQLNMQLNLSNLQVGKIILQWQNTNLLQSGLDTNAIKFQKKLPEIIDVKSVNVGIIYEYRNTNYKYNPLRGTELNITALTGIKTIKKNSNITNLNNGGFNFSSLYDSIKVKSYQIRIKIAAAKYFPLSKASTFKAAINMGVFNSPTIFRNEVFQIGGFKLLRGFDEESIYATQYAVTTAEYRSLLSLNSYLYGFSDIGLVKTNYQSINNNNFFISAGIGIVYETKAGLLNLSLALGKRNDVTFNLKQATKIHFGYVNYF